ncbi:hypothetical protein BDD43_2823 [Mucilaginibacter gracilis]|uniref:Uncharacterized protein n=1 Tax=Mucilaginibacter gracilis TaxID=423350 RepID=A0A495J2P0_9SPHI|nr:hypothetical protein [Mucilaginibacter gracilis]RKR82638.1 hypothetical protein BDD43_2823 [Mucilaginibacter gracilis]
MTGKVFTKIFNIINAKVAFVISRYPDDETQINDWYLQLLVDIKSGDVIHYVDFLTLLISWLEQKEDYVMCADLFKLKNKIEKWI